MSASRGRVIVAHYHEIGLKGRNRSFFEQALARNIRTALSGLGYDKVKLISGRVLIHLQPDANWEAVSEQLRKVFGLSSYSPAVEVEPEMDALVAAALEMARDADFATFRIRARRGNSSFPQNSQTINEVLGDAVRTQLDKKVQLNDPEWTCHIELVENRAFMYHTRFEGPGGLPVGTSGRVLALLSGGIDSPVAAWQIAKRGASVSFVHFHGQPFSDPSSVRQATRLARALREWVGRTNLWLVPFGDIQSQIVTSAPQELRIVLYRRFMMRIAEAIAINGSAQALVTGESLGQVASQTLPNITAVGDAVDRLPILRPLIGNDKIEIEAKAKAIGTYEISIDPHQDCCVLFVPRRVTTAARPADVASTEAKLDVEALVGKGVANAELLEI